MKNYTILILFVSLTSIAQELKIKGVVSDDTGPLPGASIVIKHSKVGTETNFDGEYELTAKEGDILVFSFIGFKTKEIIVTKQNTINVELTIDVELESGTFCCCYPTTSLTMAYSHSKNYTSHGLQLQLKNLYLLRQSLNISFEYHSDFDINDLYKFELQYNNTFYLGSSVSTSFKTKQLDINAFPFTYKDYRIVFNTYKRILFQNYNTNLNVGFGINELNTAKNWGVNLGFKQGIFSNISIYFDTTYWNSFWEFNSGLELYYKRFTISFVYNTIEAYEDYKIGLGYTLYL